jgi:hypothetical protein
MGRRAQTALIMVIVVLGVFGGTNLAIQAW